MCSHSHTTASIKYRKFSHLHSSTACVTKSGYFRFKLKPKQINGTYSKTYHTVYYKYIKFKRKIYFTCFIYTSS